MRIENKTSPVILDIGDEFKFIYKTNYQTYSTYRVIDKSDHIYIIKQIQHETHEPQNTPLHRSINNFWTIWNFKTFYIELTKNKWRAHIERMKNA